MDDDQPQIHIISSQIRFPHVFQRITVTTTSPESGTVSSRRTHPVWHNPNFISTKEPLQIVLTSTIPSPLIQRNTRPKWPHQRWDGNNQNDHHILQVSSMMKTIDDQETKGGSARTMFVRVSLSSMSIPHKFLMFTFTLLCI